MGQEGYPFSWFTYAPAFSPDTTTITDTSTIIGSNIEQGDGPIERHVLQEVGSYGYQLNRIIDVLWILLEHATTTPGMLAKLKPDGTVDRSRMPKDQAQAIKEFYQMAAKAAKESEDYKSKAAELAADGLISRMNRLYKSDKKLYDEIRKKLQDLPK